MKGEQYLWTCSLWMLFAQHKQKRGWQERGPCLCMSERNVVIDFTSTKQETIGPLAACLPPRTIPDLERAS